MDISSLSAAKLSALLNSTAAESDKILDKLIAAGYGSDTPSAMRLKAAQGDALCAEFVRHAEKRVSVLEEKKRRMEWSGSLKPIKH